ncbi:hypothetical protein D3C81_1623320 [compost metagenome]
MEYYCWSTVGLGAAVFIIGTMLNRAEGEEFERPATIRELIITLFIFQGGFVFILGMIWVGIYHAKLG